MTKEAKARIKINKLLEEACWFFLTFDGQKNALRSFAYGGRNHTAIWKVGVVEYALSGKVFCRRAFAAVRF